jgi:hypothetical protein
VPANTVLTLALLLSSSVLSAEWLSKVGDKDTSLLASPALVYMGDLRGKGSATYDIAELGLDGYQILTPRSDGTAGTTQEIPTGKYSVAVAPYQKAYSITDFAKAIETGLITEEKLASDAVKAAANTLVDMIAQVVGDFTNVSGTTNTSLTGLVILAAKNALAARGVPGLYVLVVSGTGYGQFQAWLATQSGGSIQWMEASKAQIEAYGDGFKGSWGGVGIFVSNRIPTTSAGVDHASGMFGRGAILWADSSFAPENDPNIIDFGGTPENPRGKVRFERDRDGLAAETTYITNAHLGVAVGQNEAGQAVLHKAAAA